MLPEDSNIPTVNTLIGPVGRGSVLHKQLKGFQMAGNNPCIPSHSEESTDNQPRQLNDNTPIATEFLNNSSPNLDLTHYPLLPNKCYVETVDLNLFSNAPNILNEVQVSLQAAQELYAKTTAQGNNNLWREERKHRITALYFGKILKRKGQPTPEFIRAICDQADISNLPFVKYGRENEDKVADMYVKKMDEERNKGLRVAEVGLCVNPTLPLLGASLDCIVFDPMSNDKFGGLEIKNNPKAGSMGLSIADTVGHPSFGANYFLVSKDGQIKLNTEHIYYYQLQGQLGLSVLPWIDFTAHSGIGDIFKEQVFPDKELNSFFFNHALDFFLLNEPKTC